MEEKTRSHKKNITENLVPILLLASVVLAFVVGVLWQKVNSLEKGGTTTTTGTTAGTTQPAADPSSILADLPAVAKTVGVDETKFKSCLDSEKYKDRVDSDYQTGVSVGVSGTPGNFIVNDKGQGWFLAGALPYATVKQVVEMAEGKTAEVDLSNQGVSKMTSDQLAKLPRVQSQDHVRGDRNAKILLIEYSDFQCPFCQRFHPTEQQMLSEYKDTALVLRHFPLEQLHPYARGAAYASECIAELGGDDAFWKFTDTVWGS